MSESTTAIAASSVPLHISGIVIRLDDASKKKIEFAELQLGSQLRKIQQGSGQNKDLGATFDPAIAVTTERVSLSVHCQHNKMGVSLRTTTKFSFDRKDILSNAAGQNVTEHLMTNRKVTVVVKISSGDTRQLQTQSTDSDILEICPRFRLLVIGNTGVGKSSLIERAFKTEGVDVAEHMRGKADINTEFTAQDNKRFVLHDSEGFEGGDRRSYLAAKEFISRRREMLELKDKIHAVWLCLSIPYAGGRLLENGVQEFLQLKKEILGDIPIIVVFTMYDLLINTLELEPEGCDEAAFEKLKEDTLNNLCVRPLEDVAGRDVLHATVSTKCGYENTIRQLVDLTTTHVEKGFEPEPALAMMIAQRVHIGLKVKASIAIGKKRYWRGLASSVDFTGLAMQSCLSVIHKDIIDVWNFNDSDYPLADDKFQELIRNDLDAVKFPDATQALEWGASVAKAIVDIVTSLGGSGLTIAVPIVAGVVVAKCAYGIYQHTIIALRQIMTYIVDLTCIMQIMFLLAPASSSISGSVIDIAIKAYDGAGKGDVHKNIQSWNMRLSRSDDALEKIIGLIKDHTISDEQAQDLRTKIRSHIQLDDV
ncbi:hypothetical protein DFH29DRAFT_831860 [Suillus ampliporus]|nr:hypothetical protein DFH29DRAFT_831860 [Suillus ampliporus]